MVDATPATAAVRCYHCGADSPQARVQACRICQRPFCLGCAYLMRGDPYCSKACGYAHKFPDEGQVYVGGRGASAAGGPRA